MVHEMSYESVSTVVESWEQILLLQDHDEIVGITLFRKFFEMAPSAIPVFSFGKDSKLDDKFFSNPRLVKHAKLFVHMLDRAIGLLGPEMEMLSEILAELGKVHARVGVLPSHYPVMGEALIDTLEEILGEQHGFNHEVRLAWEEIFHNFTDDMMVSTKTRKQCAPTATNKTPTYTSEKVASH